MNETTKLNAYRIEHGYHKFFHGVGIDIGCGPDPLDPKVFSRIESVRPYDVQHGNAQLCTELEDNSFDFVYSSHCLEHLDDPEQGMRNWIRICRPDGHIVFAVPHEIYYEKGFWPSTYGWGHKHSFRMEKTTKMPCSIHIHMFLHKFIDLITILRCDLVLENFNFVNFWEDQTRGAAICQIECVLRKKISSPSTEGQQP